MAVANKPSRIQSRLNGRFLSGVFGVLFATVGFAILAEPLLAVLVGAVLVVAHYFLPAPFAFALGQFALIGVLPAEAATSQLVTAEAGLLVVLIGPTLFDEDPLQLLGILLIALVCLGALWWELGRVTDVHWQIALVLAGSVALVAYGLHRYERVQLDLVREA